LWRFCSSLIAPAKVLPLRQRAMQMAFLQFYVGRRGHINV
jgi:hypothetical protein